jgi:hypothetical protein
MRGSPIYLLCVIVTLCACLFNKQAVAQSATCPNGVIGPYSVHIGTGHCDVAGGDAVTPSLPQIITMAPIGESALPACSPSTEGALVYVKDIGSLCYCRPVNGDAGGAYGYGWECPPP